MDPSTASPAVVLAGQIQDLSSQVHQLSGRIYAQEVSTHEPKVSLPDRFCGDRKSFVNFRESCKLYFRLRPRSSGGEQQRVGWIISLLQGDPQSWAFSLASTDPALSSVDAFFSALGLIYDDPDRQASAETNMRNLRQGSETAEAYCSQFRRWAIDSGWNDVALRSQFRLGLSEQVKDGLINHPSATSLGGLMELAIRIDRRHRERQQEKKALLTTPFAADPVPQVLPEEPMQLGGLRLSREERSRRIRAGLCIYCAEKGHLLARCPRIPGRREVLVNTKGVHLGVHLVTSGNSLLIPAVLSSGGTSMAIKAFIDSGAAANFLDISVARSLGVVPVPLPTPIVLRGVDGQQLSSGHVLGKTPPIRLQVGSVHCEEI